MPKNPRYRYRWQNRFAKAAPTGPTDPRMKEYADWLRAAGRAESTIEDKTGVVERFARELGVSCVSACHDDVVTWFAGQQWSPATRAKYFEHLNAWFAWLRLMEYRTDNPMGKLPKTGVNRREPRPCSDSDLVRLLATPRMHHKTRVMILFAALAGMRVHEVAQIKGEDIDAGRGVIWVMGKGKVLASVPLHPVLVSAAATMPASGWWFESRERPGRHMRAQSVSCAIARVMRRARVSGTPHSLRHWYGSSLLANGADLLTIKDLMRHASVATTQIYVKVPAERQHEAVATLDPWASARAQLLNR